VNKVRDLWELDLADMVSLATHYGGYMYILKTIDVLSKYAYSVPTLSKTGEAVAMAFRSILDKSCGRKPL
jgi:hypothetical protein